MRYSVNDAEPNGLRAAFPRLEIPPPVQIQTTLAAAGGSLYVLLSAITFVVYALDKSAARTGGRRTPEVTLHALALAGGWPGALLARRVLRHKTRKQPFRAVFWLTVVANCVVLASVVAVLASSLG